MAHCTRHLRTCITTSFFLQYANDNTSQGGEDGIIAEVFRRLDLAEDERSEGSPRVACEIGSWDGKWLSNTYSLLTGYGGKDPWRGILIEADAERSEASKSMYTNLLESQSGPREVPVCCTAMVGIIDSDHGTTLTTILNNINNESPNYCPYNFDLLSIDIDGNDFHIWQHVLECGTYRPKLVIIEFNPSIPNSTSFVQPAQEDMQQGNSLRAITAVLGMKYNYALICTTAFNAFFLSAELLNCTHKDKNEDGENILIFEDFLEFSCYEACSLYETLQAKTGPPKYPIKSSIPDYISILLDNLHAPSMVTELFQTYEGELCLVGPRKLLWHRLAINPQKIQVLSKKQRKFPFAPINTSVNDINSKDGKLLPDSPAKNSSKYGITRGRAQDTIDDQLFELRSVVCSELVRRSGGDEYMNNKDIIVEKVKELIAKCVPVHRYEESAIELAICTLLLVHKVDSDETNFRDTYTFREFLQNLFVKQSDEIVDIDAEISSKWLQRAEQLTSAIIYEKKHLNAAASDVTLTIYKKQCRACKLAGDVVGLWYYANQLLNCGDVQSGEKEMKRLQHMLCSPCVK